MVIVSGAPPALAGQLEIFHTTDPLLYNSPIVVFFGEAPSVVHSSSRIQVHIYTPAGLESFTRLSISPNSPFYAAVKELPRDEQADEVRRGIAYALFKYFSELPQKAKTCLTSQATTSTRPNTPFGLFSPQHVAVLVSKLARVENTQEVVEIVQRALGEQRISWLDVDIVLPAGSIQPVGPEELEHLSDDSICKRKYGRYAPIIAALGEPSFLPTSKMRRAASKPTMIGRTKTFRPGQKEIIRKEMCELVDTEANYVQKLLELHDNISVTLRSKVSTEPVLVKALDALFPASLKQILEKNSAFLTDIQSSLDTTEEAAMNAIEADQSPEDIDEDATDPGDQVGITSLAKTLLKHLPEFESMYSAYMTSNATSPRLVRMLLSSSNQDVVEEIHNIGDQRLTSLLIEPVQRLPRYTLYIDTISKQLPTGHPALVILLKARDVVTNICLSDGGQLKNEDVEQNLVSLIDDFPASGDPSARLITMIDVRELGPPFAFDDTTGQQGVLIVFTDRVVFAEKCSAKSFSARALQAEAQKVRTADHESSSPQQKHLAVTFTAALQDCIITESATDKAVTIYRRTSPQVSESTEPVVFLLEGSYAGKALRLAEEFAKARLEGRFTETDRERPTWEVRSSVANSSSGVSFFSAVFEHGQQMQAPGHVRIELDLKGQNASSRVDAGVDTLIRISPGGNTFCTVAVDSIYGATNREKIALEDLLSVLTRRIQPVLQAQLSMSESPLVASLVAKNRDILESLNLVFANDTPDAVIAPRSPTKIARPSSPVKTLSNFLANKTNVANAAVPKRTSSIYTAVPNLQPRVGSYIPKSNSRENSRPSSKDEQVQVPEVIEPTKERVNPFQRLEDVFATYVLAIRFRKGNVPGRNLKARANADQAQVNELYNALLEDANMTVLAAQATVDVLFAAFEKFLKVAWMQKLGPIIDKPMLERIQSEAEARSPIDFQGFFLDCYQNMPPQNQRALKRIVELLAHLLEGTSNDGDRGILTAAFTELLVPDEEPYTYVSLMDRFVEDMESLFGIKADPSSAGSAMGPQLGHSRSKSANTGSVNSNTSSFRRKFGFGAGVSRENSKSEQDHRAGSVWRSLSKNKHGNEPATPRGSIQRTRSTDSDPRSPMKHPASSDVPATLGAFAFERPMSQDSNYLMGTTLSTIGENGSGTPAKGPTKKKRRSSLSDLSLLQSPQSTPARTPTSIRLTKVEDSQKAAALTAISTPTRNAPRSRLPSSFRNETSPSAIPTSNTGLPRPRAGSKQPDEVTITSYTPTKPSTTTVRPSPGTKTPGPPSRIGLSEKPSANAMKVRPSPSPGKTSLPTPTALPTPTKKLRLQSPQRLRERMQSEDRELQHTLTTLAALQDELSKISGQQQPPSSVRATTPSSGGPTATELHALSAAVSGAVTALAVKNKVLEQDALAALAAEKNRTRRLDELYREANAENEALYRRFNEELGKVAKAVRGGDGLAMLRNRIKDLEVEMEGLRRERATLKRQVAGLRGRLDE